MLVNYHKKDPYHFILYRRVRKIIVLTEIQKANHLAFLPVDENQLAVIPDWVSFPAEKLNEKIYLNSFFKKEFSNYPIMVMASRLDPQKGQDLAIQALKIAIEKDRPFLLVIIGDNTIGEKNVKIELISMVEKLNLKEYVHFHGFVENIFSYLCAAHAVLIPSYEESFGRVVIESMAVGTPVIASKSGGIPNLIKDQEDGIFHEKKDANDLELKIHQLMHNPQLHKKISDYSKTTAKQYSKEIIFQKIKDLIFS